MGTGVSCLLWPSSKIINLNRFLNISNTENFKKNSLLTKEEGRDNLGFTVWYFGTY